MSRERPGRPPLAVIVATTQPWPSVAVALDSLYAQAVALGAEVIVMDGHGRALDGEDRYPCVEWVRRPGLTVFQLRGRGLRMARGEVTAVTEDHCRVAPDWCRSVLAAHADRPEAAVIGGIIENGATESMVDWANFLISNGGFVPPLPRGSDVPVTGQANVSYKRWALANYPADALHEGGYRAALRARGIALCNDERVRVSHVQSLGALGTCLIQFHDGRCVAASRRSHQSPAKAALELAKGVLLPLRVGVASLRVVGRAWRRRPQERRVAVASLPWIVLVMGFHAAGELTGLIVGPGKSPARMR
jgi:hypothetical protein